MRRPPETPFPAEPTPTPTPTPAAVGAGESLAGAAAQPGAPARPCLPRWIVRRLADRGVRSQRSLLTELVVGAMSEEEWRTWMAWARYWQGPVPSGKGGPRRNDDVQFLTSRGLLYGDGARAQHLNAETLIEGLEYLLEEFEASGAGGLLIGLWLQSHTPWSHRLVRPVPAEAQRATWHDVPTERLAAALQTMLRLKHERILEAVLRTWPAEVLGLTDAVVWRLAARRANGTSDTWAETEDDLESDARRTSQAPVISLLGELGLREAPAALAARQDWPLDVQRWLIDAGGSGMLSKVGRGPAVPSEELCGLLRHEPRMSSTWAETRRLAQQPDGVTDPAVATMAAQVLSARLERLIAIPVFWDPDSETAREIEVWQTEHVGPWIDTPAFVAALSRPSVRHLLLSSSNAALRQRLIGMLGQMTEEQGAAAVRSLRQIDPDQSGYHGEDSPRRAAPARRP